MSTLRTVGERGADEDNSSEDDNSSPERANRKQAEVGTELRSEFV